MSKTIEEVRNMVLRVVGRFQEGNVPNSNTAGIVEDAYDGLYDELLNDSLVNWSKADDLPEFAVNPVKILLSSRVAFDFGVPNVWAQFEDVMRLKLSQQIASPYVSQPTQAEYY